MTDVIFTDLKKVFITYFYISFMLSVYQKNSILLFNSYLHDRKQCVVLQGSKSDLFVQERGDLLYSGQRWLIDMQMMLSFMLQNLNYCKSKVLFNQTSICYKDASYVRKYCLTTRSYTMVFGPRQSLKRKQKV